MSDLTHSSNQETLGGRVIHHQPAHSGVYVGSPSIAILPNGDYVASHDLFGAGGTEDTTLIHTSKDRGISWSQVSTIRGAYWSGLFIHRGALYLFGPDKMYGSIVIRKSQDGGHSWTTPSTPNRGRLRDDSQYHSAPVPVVICNGRIWRAVEEAGTSDLWPVRFRPTLMSAPVNRSLLRSANWTNTPPLDRPTTSLNGKFVGWLEGNVVVNPSGKIVNVVRVDSQLSDEQVAILELSADQVKLEFRGESSFAPFPGGSKKFTIRFDPVSNKYWTLTNWVPEAHSGRDPVRTRNTLVLASSKNLREWSNERILAQHPDPVTHGFQYADWLVEGDDIVAVVRTAAADEFGGAPNQHDANYLTFLRVSQFRVGAGFSEGAGPNR